MDNHSPIYNSRVIKTRVEHLAKYYPDVDINTMLEYSEMKQHEVNDPAHWFSQYQTDRFHKIMEAQTGNQNIDRAAGHHMMESLATRSLQKHLLGYVNLLSAFKWMMNLYPILSKGASVKTKKLASNKVEIVCKPKPGIDEKPYQCEIRIGSFESVAKFFTGKFPKMEHPSCFHKGDDSCCYIISWKEKPHILWKRIRNYSLLLSILVSLAFFFLLPVRTWMSVTLISFLLTMVLSFYSDHLEKKDLTKTIETQGDSAKDLLDEINFRRNYALLVQKIGRASSTIFDIDHLIQAVVNAVVVYLDFDQGMILLANKEKTHLDYRGGFGYSKAQETLLKQKGFPLDNVAFKEAPASVFQKQKPFLLDRAEISDPSRSPSKFAEVLGAWSLICVPIVYEKESLGVLVVNNITSKRQLISTDAELLAGTASQMAVGISNARSFQRLKDVNESLTQEIKTRKHLENELEDLLEIEQLISSISSQFISLSFGQVRHGIDKVLEMLGNHGDEDRVFLFQVSEDGTHLNNTSQWCKKSIQSSSEHIQNLPIDLDHWIKNQLLNLDVVHVPYVAQLPPAAGNLKKMLQQWSARSFLVIPITSDSKLFGCIFINAIHKEKTWDKNHIKLLHTVSEILGNACARMQAEEKLLIYQSQLRSLSSDLLLTEELERRRIASEIHDCIGHTLSNAKIKLGLLKESIPMDGAAGLVSEIKQLIDQSIQETQSLSFELSPPILSDLGLEAAVDWLIEKTQNEHGLKITFSCDMPHPAMDDSSRVLIFQSIRELLFNIVKHSKAQNATISIKEIEGYIKIIIEDDGIGFDTSKISTYRYNAGGFGLFSIRERLSHKGGYLQVDSEPGKGARMTMVSPINNGGKVNVKYNMAI